MVGIFTASDFLNYATSILKEAKLRELSLDGSDGNYSWLKAKHHHQDAHVDTYLTDLLPVIMKITDVSVSEEDQETVKGKELPLEQFSKAGNRCPFEMSPESCTAIAVKLDTVCCQTELSLSSAHILTTLKTLLREQDSMDVIAGTVKQAKETKNRKIKVHPVLEGREPTVSFIVYSNKV